MLNQAPAPKPFPRRGHGCVRDLDLRPRSYRATLRIPRQADQAAVIRDLHHPDPLFRVYSTTFGVVGFTPRLGMFYEVPVAQYRDCDDVSGFPSGTDANSLGDANLKFIGRPAPE